MFTQIRTRYSRTPLPYLGILLFAVIISTILCYLEASNVREQQNFEESYQTIPVYVSVTNLSASQSDNLTVPLWLAEVFKYDSIMKPSLNRFVAELDYKLAHEGEIAFNQGELVSVMGLTSCVCRIISDLTAERSLPGGRAMTRASSKEATVCA